MFPAPGDTDALAAAKVVCQRCPVYAHCLDFALSTNIEDGVWGSKSEKERRKIKSNLSKARRLKV